MNNSKKVNEKWSKKDYQKSSKRVYSRSDKAITLIALIVTIIVLLILAGVTINLAVNNQGIFNKAKTATRAYKNASENEQTGLDEANKEIAKYMPKEGSEGGSGSESGGGTSGSGSSGSGTASSGSITYTDSAGKPQTLKKDTPAGTKIGTTENISGKDGETGVNLDWYLFDISDDGKTAYLVSTPTYWVPDPTKPEVSGAYSPKLVSSRDKDTNGLRQAIKYGTNSYTPSKDTLSYYKRANSQWSTNRGSVDFKDLNENEQEACYLADADIFAGIKDQVNKAEGNLKGKIQTLVGGASVEQWCKAYNKQAIVKEKQPKGITCEYSTIGCDNDTVPGYIYKVNGTASDSGFGTGQDPGWFTDAKTIFGNDIYGAAKNNGNITNNPFYNESWWWLASPSSFHSDQVCDVWGYSSDLYANDSYFSDLRLSLLASVSCSV